MGHEEATRVHDPADAATRGSRARRAAAASARRAQRAATVTGRTVGRTTGRAAGYTFRQARRATHAEGAGESGLSRLIELHAFNSAGDAAVAISLAGTLFFQAPTEQARSQVALFLGLTMLPFAIVAPLVGPLLDRFGHGRRWAVGATLAARAFLCWVLAGAVAGDSMALFPAALGCLVASKAYGVTRAAAVPRLLPEQLTLVRANSRISLAGLAGGAVSAPLAVLASTAGPQWSLRYAFLVFVGGTILAVLLPARVDSAQGEEQLALATSPDPEPAAPSEATRTEGTRTEGPGGRAGARRPRARVPPAVALALRCNAGLRLLSGFLTMFMAFLLRDQPFPGWEQRPALLLALVVGSAGLGSAVGITLGSLLRTVRPEATVVAVLVTDAAVTVVVAVLYGLLPAVLLGLTAGLTQSLGKLSLDALIQRDVPERGRSSAFARSETMLQLAWVVGGFIGIALPLVPQAGLGVAAALLTALSVVVLAQGRLRRA